MCQNFFLWVLSCCLLSLLFTLLKYFEQNYGLRSKTKILFPVKLSLWNLSRSRLGCPLRSLYPLINLPSVNARGSCRQKTRSVTPTRNLDLTEIRECYPFSVVYLFKPCYFPSYPLTLCRVIANEKTKYKNVLCDGYESLNVSITVYWNCQC